jgi:hypothetical protein
MVFTVAKRRTHKDPRILADDAVRMSRKGSAEKYPATLRRMAVPFSSCFPQGEGKVKYFSDSGVKF